MLSHLFHNTSRLTNIFAPTKTNPLMLQLPNFSTTISKKISSLTGQIFKTKISQPAVIEDRSKNPLYKALPSLFETSQALLNFKPTTTGFIPVSFRESLAANWIPTENNFFEDVGVKIAEQTFNAFCKNFLDHPRVCTIPQTVHLIWLGSPPTPSVKLAMQSWKNHNPSFEVKLWTDEEIKNFSWSCQHSKVFFEEAKNWAEKSDILRFEILYQHGGIYSDTDAICVNSVEDLTNTGLSFFAGFESNKIKRFGRPLIGSAIIGAEKNSPVIKRCLDFSLTLKEAPTIHQFIRSGPGPMTKAAYEALENGQSGVLLLPCSYLYPMPWENRLFSSNEVIKTLKPETFAIHLWEGSWFDDYHPPKTA